jgi:hypothetical protein
MDAHGRQRNERQRRATGYRRRWPGGWLSKKPGGGDVSIISGSRPHSGQRRGVARMS